MAVFHSMVWRFFIRVFGGSKFWIENLWERGTAHEHQMKLGEDYGTRNIASNFSTHLQNKEVIGVCASSHAL